MNNGNNEWGVSWSEIQFFERLLKSHGNVSEVSRENDILFTVNRIDPTDTLRILCANEYIAGVAAIMRALDEFPNLNVFYVGGIWNRYSADAKEFCIERNIGIFNAKGINGALRFQKFWEFSDSTS